MRRAHGVYRGAERPSHCPIWAGWKDQEPIVEVPARRALLYSKFEFQAPPVALTFIKCLADFVARAGFGRRQTAKVHALIGAVKQRFKYLVG